ncbi:ABC transporter ATP-binding protein [Bacillus cereus]|uniref:ABC transporter ATP-binding protein n=1 Tax=Bacillus cereus TaxID=1396 RepID=UPI0011A6B8AD|nr:ABC transporter ATP-binding protein [Bacillus cereus]
MINTYLTRSIKLVGCVCKLELTLYIIIQIIESFTPLLLLLTTQRILNGLQTLVSTTHNSTKEVMFYLILQFILTISTSLLEKVELYLFTRMQQNIEMDVKGRLTQQVVNINYENFENHEFYNLIQRFQGDLGSQFLNPMIQLLDILKNSIILISVQIFLLQFHWLFTLLTILSAIPMLLMQFKFGEQKYFLMKFQTPNARLQNYIFNLFTNRQSNKEIRLNQSHNYLFKFWRTSLKENNRAILKQLSSQQKRTLLLDILTASVYVYLAIYLLWMITKKTVKIGDFVTVTEAVQRSQGSINQITLLISSLRERTLFLEDVFTILDTPADIERKNTLFPVPQKMGIQFKNVSFTYAGANKKSLSNINLDIRPNENIIIVGSNGSGKTTLIKCLTGLYEIKEGAILIDNINIKDINRESLYENISVVHQDYVRYEFSVSDNIRLGNVKTADTDSIMKSADKAGAHEFIQNLPNQYDTILGRMFENSQDLSGGQWQRLAIARTMIRNAQTLILDEPSSSLDPITEANLFRKLIDISKDKTSIFVSHRMYACHMADRIIVMKEGEIVEIGTHEELIDQKMHYYKLYSQQANMYEKKESVYGV